MSSQAFSLIVCLPEEPPVRHDLTDATVTIGRSPENGLQVLVAEVSVKHGSIGRSGESFVIADGGSTNGTTVNGASVGPEGVALSPMDKIVFGTLVPAYFVPSVVLDSTPMEELIASIEAAPKAAVAVAQPKTAPVATAARAAVPLPGGPVVGASTVKLDQVRGPAPGGVRPAAVPLAPRQPLPGAPAGGPPKPPGAPGAPVAPRPPGVAPVTAPRPGAVQPAKLPTAPPAGAPAPIPLKRPAPGAPTIPLPKLPPKPGA
jgi:hypothetical protein